MLVKSVGRESAPSRSSTSNLNGWVATTFIVSPCTSLRTVGNLESDTASLGDEGGAKHVHVSTLFVRGRLFPSQLLDFRSLSTAIKDSTIHFGSRLISTTRLGRLLLKYSNSTSTNGRTCVLSPPYSHPTYRQLCSTYSISSTIQRRHPQASTFEPLSSLPSNSSKLRRSLLTNQRVQLSHKDQQQ